MPAKSVLMRLLFIIPAHLLDNEVFLLETLHIQHQRLTSLYAAKQERPWLKLRDDLQNYLFCFVDNGLLL